MIALNVCVPNTRVTVSSRTHRVILYTVHGSIEVTRCVRRVTYRVTHRVTVSPRIHAVLTVNK